MSSRSSLSPPPSEVSSSNAPRPLTRAAKRRADRAAQVAVANAAAAAIQNQRRDPPCLACLNSALAGQSTGECWAQPGARRCERCDPGGSCRPIPSAALPVALFFLDYVQQDPSRVNKTEKNKRRIAAKVVLKGVAAGEFPLAGDPRLA